MRQRKEQAIYGRIDNDLYNDETDPWRRPDCFFSIMHCSLNPARFGYLKRKLVELGMVPEGKSALEVGCGGGVLTEEIARFGFKITGIDPSGPSLNAARRHAAAIGLDIEYLQGSGEALPFANGTFDAVFCCDVLEHVDDLPGVIGEISRVLRPGGVFCYDTINRSFASWLMAIKVSQTWKRYAFAPSRLHVWEMFVKPGEMKRLLRENGLTWQGHRGMKPNLPILSVLRQLRKRARGELSFEQLGKTLYLVECRSLSLMYLGYAIKAAEGTNTGEAKQQ